MLSCIIIFVYSTAVCRGRGCYFVNINSFFFSFFLSLVFRSWIVGRWREGDNLDELTTPHPFRRGVSRFRGFGVSGYGVFSGVQSTFWGSIFILMCHVILFQIYVCYTTILGQTGLDWTVNVVAINRQELQLPWKKKGKMNVEILRG